MIPRTKLHLADGRKVYVYGEALVERLPMLSAADIATVLEVEPAGHYDVSRNEVVMTEPTSIVEGRSAPGA